MEPDALATYLVARAIPSEIDDGLRWLRNGMFSRLRYHEYLDVFRRHFAVEHVIAGVSQDALRYRRRNPATWRALRTRFDEADLLTFSMTVWMRPLPRSGQSLSAAPTLPSKSLREAVA
jgi:hypothetical protein